MTRLNSSASSIRRLRRAYRESTRREHDFDDYGECRGCGKPPGD